MKSIAKPNWSPWGRPDLAEEIFPGVWSLYTPRHGGFYVSAERRRLMDQAWLALGFNNQAKDGWFEEDCDWAMVALSFADEWRQWRQERADADLVAAQKILEKFILPKAGKARS